MVPGKQENWIPLPSGVVTKVASFNPERISILFCGAFPASMADFSLSTRNDVGPLDGLWEGTLQIIYLTLPIMEGLVQSDWYVFNRAGVDRSITVIEVIKTESEEPKANLSRLRDINIGAFNRTLIRPSTLAKRNRNGLLTYTPKRRK